MWPNQCVVGLGRVYWCIAACEAQGLQVARRGSAVAAPAAAGGVRDGMRRLIAAGTARDGGVAGIGEGAALQRVNDTGRVATVQAYSNAVKPSAGFAGAWGGGRDFEGLIDRAAGAGMG